MAAQPLTAALFVVPTDRDLVHRSDTVVIASALTSYARRNADGGIETVTPMSVERVIKGLNISTSIDIVEPGGELDGEATIIAGVPRFDPGQRMLILLSRTGTDTWAVSELKDKG